MPSANAIMPSAGPILLQATTQPNTLGLLHLFSPTPPPPSIPAMLAKGVQTLQFVELKELLPGNIQGRIQDFAKGGAPVHAKHAIVNKY